MDGHYANLDPITSKELFDMIFQLKNKGKNNFYFFTQFE